MAKDGRYKTVYFSSSDSILLDKIERWRNKNKTPTFNAALLGLIALGLGEEVYPIVSDKRIRSIVRDELQKQLSLTVVKPVEH